MAHGGPQAAVSPGAQLGMWGVRVHTSVGVSTPKPVPPPGNHGQQFGGGVVLAILIIVVFIFIKGSGKGDE